MEWTACSPDLNPIEYVWDILGRRIAARPRPHATVRDLEIALLEEWNSIPQSLIDNLIASMANRELKSIGVKNENCNSEEDVNLGVFKQRVHFKNDRYEVELPRKRDSDELSDNFNLEKGQLGSPMRKWQKDKVLYSEYCKVFRNYLDDGIIEKKKWDRKSQMKTELSQATERVIPLESERAKMLSMGPDAMAQPVTVPEEKCLPRALLISADEMCEEKRKDQSM
ncbi:hypothetical protein TNCV_4569491 [Trichonephila clavipes]|nr:hypothetical protein TNCV_4569491 [Trichonephila clavipes]